MPLTLEEALGQINKNVDAMPKVMPLSQAEQIDTTESILNAIPSYRDNKIERFAKGLYSGLDATRDLLPALELYGRNADLAIGGYFGASQEEVSRKAMNIATIQRNLIANQKDRSAYTSQETAESWAFGIGQGVANLLMMYASGGVVGGVVKGAGAVAAKTAAGIATGVALENVEQQSERIPLNKQGEVEAEKLTPQWAKNSTIGTTAYLAASALLEKYVGFGKQTTLWETPIKFSNKTLKNISPTLKTAAKGMLSEGLTEGLQSLTSTGILLAEGKIKMSDMPERLQQAWKEAVIGGILGGSVGTAVAINQQANVKTMLNQEIGKVVTDPKEREAIVESIYEEGTLEMTNVISKELELSSELNTKHGAIYDSMQTAIHNAIKESGALEQEAETDVAQYVSETSKMFANQVLAEANKRGCLIDDVLKASDIKYEEGMIKLQAGKEVIAEIPVVEISVSAKLAQDNEQEQKEAKEMAYNILSNATGKSVKYLKMTLGSTSEGKAKQREKIIEELGNVADQLTINGIDSSYSKYFDVAEFLNNEGNALDHNVNRKLVEQALDIIQNGYKNNFANQEDEFGSYIEEVISTISQKFDNSASFDELINLFDNELNNLPENLQDDFIIDAIVDSFNINTERLTNETTQEREKEIESNNRKTSEFNARTMQNGDDRSLQGSSNETQGQNQEVGPEKLFQSANTAGANSAEFSDAQKEWEEKGTESKYFKNWFGESKVVDEAGKPLVVYHGTADIIEVFDERYGGETTANNEYGAFFFANDKEIAEDYSRQAYIRRYEGRDREELEDYYKEQFNLTDEEIVNILDDLYDAAENQIKTVDVYLKMENPIIIDNNYEVSPVMDIQELIGWAKEGRYSDVVEKYVDIYGNQKYDESDIEDYREEIETRARENYGLEEDDEIEDYMFNEATSEVLDENGIYPEEQEYDGIIIRNTVDDISDRSSGIQDTYIVFKSEQIKSVDNRGTFDAENPNIYFQLKYNPKEPKQARGAYNVSKKAIELFKDADYSTLPHEMAHFWLDNMWSYSRSGLASDAYKNNFQAVLDFLGVKDNQIYLTRTQQEKFARAYEKYLLNGYAPNGLIQGAFDDYDRWLQKVYKDARELKVKLTADAIEFFDSMTTGELLPYTVEETNREVIEKEVTKTVKEAKKVAEEAQNVYSTSPMLSTTAPVETEGDKAQSRAYTNQAEILGLAEELDYNKANIADQNEKAKAFVKNNMPAAQRIVNGLEQPPKGILKNAIYNAYLKEMLAIGNTDAYVEALRNQSLELTRAGQEIASQRGAVEDIFDSSYWIRRIENRLKEIKAVEKFGSIADGVNENNAINKLNNYIDAEINKVLDDFVDAEPEQQEKIVKDLVAKLSAELNTKPPEKLLQRLREPSELRTRTNAYNYIYRAVNEGLGFSLNSQQVSEVVNRASALQKSIENTKDRNGNPSALFFKNMADMENFANSIAPSPALSVLTSTVGRGNMLMSAKSIALNIESNILNFISESIIKRISYGAIDKVVDANVIKEYLEYSKGVFNSSGYQISTMDELDATQRILNEKQITSQGSGIIRAMGRFYEQTIFKYGLGYPDLIFKDLAFVDSVNLLASKEADGNAQKATSIFKDAILIQPKTAIGQEIRAKAQIDALIATYQNKGRLSELALGIRNSINKATKQLRLGDVLSPFVKTPANVIGLGLDYTFGAYALKDIQVAISDFQAGRITETTRKVLQKTGRNAIGVLIAIALSSLIDDEDYIPDYALLSPTERNLIKAKNGVFNAIKVGDKWLSLDYFGPFAMPLAAVLNAKREKDLVDKAFNYLKGAGIQALKLPVIGDLKDILEEAGRATNQDADKNAQEVINGVVDFASSRTIPALVSDFAKITDKYERDTGKSALNRAKAKIPFLREELPAKVNYATGRAVETESPASVLFAGARVKTATKGSVIREIDKLYKAQTETNVRLNAITKGNSKLSTLPESEKPKAEAKFAKMYSEGVSNLIRSNAYSKLSAEDKVKAINKVRDKAVDKLKKEYGLTKKGARK